MSESKMNGWCLGILGYLVKRLTLAEGDVLNINGNDDGGGCLTNRWLGADDWGEIEGESPIGYFTFLN